MLLRKINKAVNIHFMMCFLLLDWLLVLLFKLWVLLLLISFIEPLYFELSNANIGKNTVGKTLIRDKKYYFYQILYPYCNRT